MSSAGIDSINSGPLILRTYDSTSPNKSIVLKNYDNPVSSNFVLITSSNGLLAPSDNIYVSSITVSSLSTISTFIQSAVFNDLTVSSLVASTTVGNSANISSIYINTINGLPYTAGAASYWTFESLTGDMYNANGGFLGIGTGNSITAPFQVQVNTVINNESTIFNSNVTINGSTVITDYLSTNTIHMTNGYISSNGSLVLNTGGVVISSVVNDGDADISLFNGKSLITTGTSYNGYFTRLDNEAPSFTITNLSDTTTYATFSSTSHQLNNSLTVLAPNLISSSRQFINIQNNYPGPINATQSTTRVELNMTTDKGRYIFSVTDAENPVDNTGLLSTHLQLFASTYTSIGGGRKEILDISPVGDTVINGNVTIGQKYGGVNGNLVLRGYISTISTVSTPVISMQTTSGAQGQIFQLSTINNVRYPYPDPGLIPLGGIIMWSGTDADLPLNWALCDGGSYGIPAVPTPDLRGKFMIGSRYRTGTTPYNGQTDGPMPTDANGLVCSSLVTGATGGEQYHLLTISEMPSHNHGFAQPNTAQSNYVAAGATPNPPYWLATTDGISTTTTGGSISHNNIPQFYALAYIMRISSVILI